MEFRLKIQELDPQTREQLQRFRGDYQCEFARYGDAGYMMPTAYMTDAAAFSNFVIRPDDIWINTFPRSGTTVTQELIWLLKTDFDYDMAAKRPLWDRWCYLGIKTIGKHELLNQFSKERPNEMVKAVNAPSPRFVKTHLPLSMLPTNLLDTTRLVYVARDPRDVAVSNFHLSLHLKKFVGDFKAYWKGFVNDFIVYSPYFSHVKEAWALRDHPKMLFIFYEDIIKDTPSVIRRLANFMGREVTDEQVAKLCKHVEINNFRKNQSVNPSLLYPGIRGSERDGQIFIRQGKLGGWQEWFDEEMSEQAQTWIDHNLNGTDLRFPGNS